MSENYAQPLRLNLRASPPLAALLIAVHAGAAACVWFTPLSAWVQAGIGLGVAWSLYQGLSLHAWRRAATAVTAIEIRAGQVAVRRRADTRWRRASMRSAFTHPWVVVLRLRCTGRRWPSSVVIPRDTLSVDHFRRLCVRLAYLDSNDTV